MKSIQTKFILLIIIGVLVSATMIGGTGIISFKHAIDNDSAKIMNLTCREKASELNSILEKIEQSVEIMAVYAIDNLESTDRLESDAVYRDDYINDLEHLGLTIANETDGAVAAYMRFNPELTTAKTGFFRVKNSESGQFETFEPTDLALYSSDDTEHVGWYYEPVRNGKATWMEPYDNKNIDVYMISYVIPIYKNQELVGVVGMDIDFHYLAEQVDGIRVYEAGEAFLTNGSLSLCYSSNQENHVLTNDFNKDSDFYEQAASDTDCLYDYTINEVENKVAFQVLENHMYLAVMAPVREINRTRNKLIVRSVVMVCLIVFVFVLVAQVIAGTIVRPLKELNTAAKKIAGGNLEVSLSCQSKDEVGHLSESLAEMVNHLKRRIAYINSLAYMDMLTGVKNNTAYSQEISLMKEEMQKGDISFSVFVIDVNGLKEINDTYGHDYGNELIMKAADLIAEVFADENIYRIGGDEFAVILRDADQETCSRYEQKFMEEMRQQQGEMRLSAAIGSAVYDKNTDDCYESVFRRADGNMYKRKIVMKSQDETSKSFQKAGQS